MGGDWCEGRDRGEGGGRWQEGACGRGRLFDAHCHLGFAEAPKALARGLAAEGVGCFSNAVTPAEYDALAPALKGVPGIHVGLGMHPWWLLDGTLGEADVALFERRAAGARFIGEIGLDHGRRFEAASPARRALMEDAFRRAVRACASAPVDAPAKVLSLHAVRAAGAVLDALEESECAARHACILHWFSGTSEELARAVGLGCRFSVGPHMLESRRGREYARQIPLDRLLLETDEPPEGAGEWDARAHRGMLEDAVRRIAALRRTDEGALARALDRNAAALFGDS